MNIRPITRGTGSHYTVCSRIGPPPATAGRIDGLIPQTKGNPMIHATVKSLFGVSLLGAIAAAGVLAHGQARAQSYPAKPITAIGDIGRLRAPVKELGARGD